MDIQKFKFACGVILFSIIIFGTFGNLVSLLIWSKGQRCRTLPGAVYFIALAASDTLVLCLTATYYAVDFTFEVNLSDLSVFSCKFLNTTWHFTLLLSTYTVVCLTVERVIAVGWPLQSARWNSSRQRTALVILMLVVVCFVLNIPWTVGNALLPVNQSDQTSLYGTPVRRNSNLNHSQDKLSEIGDATEENWIKEVKLTCQSNPSSFIFKYETEWHKWFVDFCLLFSIPLLIITVCNVIILMIVCRRRSRLTDQNSGCSGHTYQSMSNTMTLRVVAISVVHCISVGPYSVAVLVPEFINNVGKNDTITCLYILFTFIWYINHASNFLLYNICGRTFRRDCKQLLYNRRTVSYSNCDTRSARLFGTELVSFGSLASDRKCFKRADT